MERRFSCSSNSSRLSIPIADSTRIDGTSNTNRPAILQLQTSLSPKQQSSSSICLSSSFTNGIPKNKELHNLSRPSLGISKTSRQKLNLSQLDPKIYADVNSSGIASRAVRYQQESSAGLRRSMSFNSLHSPLMQPRRSSISSPLSHKPNLPSLSMTRIAPPERSFYCGNTLPSLMRSNSLLGVEKSNEQLARENRPIIHPTSLQHECEPTRSVLEELKEISRKRINSGDIQQNDYSSKKSCSRMTDFVDHHNHYQHFSNHQQHLSMLQPQAGFKRQRELTVTVPLRLHHAPIVMPQHQQHQHQQQPQLLLSNHNFTSSVSPQQSPEQLAKRRNCSYSNDIASSLSSSKLHTNKRKLYDKRGKQRQMYNDSKVGSDANSSGTSSTENSPSQQATKIQRKQPNTDLRLDNLNRTQSTPITPLPATPAQRIVSAPELPARTQDKAEPSKPKLTLFNTRHQQQQALQPLYDELPLDLKSPDVEDNEYAGIQFVKPKQQNSFTGIKNSNMERTQKTKLALMLSSLRGEIYLDRTEKEQADVPDAKQPCKLLLPSSRQSIVAVTTTITVSPTKTATTTVATSTKSTTLSVEVSVSLPELKTSTVSTATCTTTSSASSLISFDKPEITNPTADKTSESTVTANNFFTGFKMPTTLATSDTTNAKMPLLQFKNTSTTSPIVSDVTTTSVAASPAPALTFGQLSATSVTGTTTATTTTSSTTFLFGNAVSSTQETNNSTSTTATAPATTVASTPMFSFGQPASVGTSKTSSVVTPTTTIAPLFSFGNATTVAGAAATTTTTTTSATSVATNTVSPTFKFANVGGTTSAIAPPVFSTEKWVHVTGEMNMRRVSDSNSSFFGSPFKSTSTASTETSATEPPKLFNFATAINTSATPTTTSTTTPTTTPAAMPATASIFGSPATTSTSMFSFGGSMPTVATTTTAATSNSNMFSFGASAAAKPVATATSFAMPDSSNSNLFSFGGISDATKSSKPAPTAVASNFSFNPPATASQAATSSFSFNDTPKQSSVFGGSSSSNNTNASKPFAFGGIAAPSAQQHPPAAAVTAQVPLQSSVGGFSFAAAAQQSESTNIFGSPSGTNGIGKPNFNFGGSSMPAAGETSAPVANTFGGFSSSAQTASQSKPFSYPPAGSKMRGNLFASAVSAVQNQQQPKSGGFSFSTSNNNSSAASTQANSNPPFAFGSMTSPSQTTNMVKPFAFGGGASTATSTNIFGGAVTSSSAATTNGGTFNFGGATTTNRAPQHLNAGNVFAPPSTPENRPIRRATRRLQK